MSERIDIVLVHGWAGSAESWEPIVEQLAEEDDLRLHALRLPGSPGAAASSVRATIGAAAQELIALLREFGRPSVLVGHSLGGQVTLRAHGVAPELVQSEIVVDPAYGAAEADRGAMIRWADAIDESGHGAVSDFFEQAAHGLSAPDLMRLRADLAATPVSVITGYLRSEYVDSDAVGMLPASARAAALRVKPVLAIHRSPEGVERERALPSPAGSRVELWEESGHYLHLQHPIGFADTVARWARDTRVSA